MRGLDLKGQRFGKLVAIERVSDYVTRRGNRETQWLCQCDCGNQTVVMTRYLRNGHSTSCGCKYPRKEKKRKCKDMALEDYLVPRQSRTNICFDCQKACGDCSWSEIDPATKHPRFEPVPGWTAEKVLLRIDHGHGGFGVETYHITACPQFVPDEPRETSRLELSDLDWVRILRQMGRVR